MPAPRYEERYDDGSVRFAVTLDSDDFIRTRFSGRGTMDGTRAFIRMVEACLAVAGPQAALRALVDLSELDGAPLLSQAMLGRWLMGQRQRFLRIAIAGGGRVEQKLAKAVLAMARMDNVGFFPSATEATSWLGR